MSILRKIKSWLINISMFYVKRLCKQEYVNQKFISINERPIEFSFLFRVLVETWPEKILDVGTGMTALPHLMRNCGFHVTATDNIKDYWPQGMVNRHFHVLNDDITNSKLNDKFDVITCISVLEHIEKHKEAVKTMYNKLNSGGKLILTCPYNEKKYAPNVYDLAESPVNGEYSFITQAFSRNELNEWINETTFEIVEQEFWQFFDGEYWTCGNRVMPPKKVDVSDNHQLTCMVLQKK